MPRFGVDAYAELLTRLRESGYRLAPVTALADPGPTVLLRHDVDLDPPSTLAMAEREAQLGVAATYYVPLTQHFNVLDPVQRDAIRQLAALGHEIGLHYDMRTYPLKPAAAREHLDWELETLAAVAQTEVRTLCMHQPHRGHEDPFRSLPGLVHPHDPSLQDGLLYVSDSCRRWRDDSLLSAFTEERPSRLLLNFHPELWLDDSIDDSMSYLEQVVAPLGAERARAAILDEAEAWRNHPTAAKA